MRESAWNTTFGRLLIIVSLLAAIGGCVYASSLVEPNQNATGVSDNIDENLTSTDMNSFEANTVMEDQSAVTGPADEPAPQFDESSSLQQQEPYVNGTDMNATDENSADAE